jgi:hypothetical protein
MAAATIISLLVRITHVRICCNRRSAALGNGVVGLWFRVVGMTLRNLKLESRNILDRNFVTNRREYCGFFAVVARILAYPMPLASAIVRA